MYIEEEGVKIKKYEGKISKELPVFFNPEMKLNRDISLVVLRSYFKDFSKKIKVCLPLAGSGVRGIRFLKDDFASKKIELINVNDLNPVAFDNIKSNLINNDIDVNLEVLKLTNKDANCAILSGGYWDYIEIDPFGSPAQFLDSAVQRIKHGGLLSVTATDIATLCGVYEKTCLRRYFIKCKKLFWHEELGLRNLIAFCIVQGARYKKNLVPILSYSKRHYFKVFFRVEESREDCLSSLKRLGYVNQEGHELRKSLIELSSNCLGKTYLGDLKSVDFLNSLDCSFLSQSRKVEKLLESLKQEIEEVGYFQIHKISKDLKLKHNPKFSLIIERLEQRGFLASKAHNSKYAIKTDASYDVLVEILNE